MRYEQALKTANGNHRLAAIILDSAKTALQTRKGTNARLTQPGALHAAALWYAEQGHPIFPCTPGEKRPATRHGCLDATTNIDQINQWWAANPNANIGLATGHRVDVVDLDKPEKEPDILAFFRDGDLPLPVARAKTPRGVHLYIPATGAGNTVNLINGVDYRGKGGYVIAPPSRLANGNTYRWEYYELEATA